MTSAARDAGRDGEHQHRREERGLAARDVEPHAADRQGPLHAAYARHRLDAHLRGQLGAVERLDVGLRGGEGLLQFRGDAFGGGAPHLGGNFETHGLTSLDAARDGAQGAVAAALHFGEDRGDLLRDLLLGARHAFGERRPFGPFGLVVYLQCLHVDSGVGQISGSCFRGPGSESLRPRWP